ncbi:MAG: Gfo/Idh/MocA family oxidoreductase [candidate division KSB1 bacterium]|nr:Gfo/Idh/MocA family oxidoreductase [candidate division KSB1 bacterium]
MRGDTLGIAILGAGSVAEKHAEALSSLPGFHLKAVWRRNREKGLAFAERHNTEFIAELDEILAREDIRVVDIAAPPALHHQLGEKAAAAGKHVIVEKPIDATLAGADRLIQACGKAGVCLAVISQYRFTDGAQFVHRAIREGALGEVFQADAYVKWYRPQSYYDQDAWRGTPDLEGGGVLINQAIHFIDLLLWWLGPVRRLVGRTQTVCHQIPVEDHAVAMLEFAGGAWGVLEASTATWPGFPARLELHGTKGSARFEGDGLVLWEVRDYPCRPPLVEARSSGAREAMAIDVEPFRRQFQDIYEAITEQRRPLVDGHEARRALEVVLAIYRSSARGEAVVLPLATDR